MQFIEQFLGFLQIARVEAFSGPVVHGSQEFPRLLHLALVAPETCEAHGGAQFPGFGFLLAGDRERALEIRFSFRGVRLQRLEHDFTGNSMDCPVRSQRALWSYGAVALSGSSLNSVVGVDS